MSSGRTLIYQINYTMQEMKLNSTKLKFILMKGFFPFCFVIDLTYVYESVSFSQLTIHLSLRFLVNSSLLPFMQFSL